jgi:hypothetical protein
MKKSGIKLVAAACAVMAASNAHAQTRGGFELGAELFDYSYRERFEGELVAQDDGLFGGIGLGYVETIGNGIFLRSRLNVAVGSVDYRSSGTILDDGEDGEARLDNVSQSIGQLELHIGKDFSLGGGTTLTPFIGLASRVLSDKSGGEETEGGLLGYDREISYAYVPLGAAARFEVGGRSSLTLSGQYNWFVGGDAKSKFSDLDPELPDVEVELEQGSGFEASALLSLPLGRKAISFGPFVRRWSIGQSESFVLVNPDDPSETLELFEPKNRTTEVGFRIGFAF